MVEATILIPVLAKDGQDAEEEAATAISEELHNADYFPQEIPNAKALREFGTVMEKAIPWGSSDDKTCSEVLMEWDEFIEEQQDLEQRE